MKKVSLLFAFIALFATASFAGTNEEKVINSKSLTTEKKAEPLKAASCTVTVSWPNGSGGTNTLTVTTSCNSATCTTQQACDAAYAIISVVVPG